MGALVVMGFTGIAGRALISSTMILLARCSGCACESRRAAQMQPAELQVWLATMVDMNNMHVIVPVRPAGCSEGV
jgi:hypothetical protein